MLGEREDCTLEPGMDYQTPIELGQNSGHSFVAALLGSVAEEEEVAIEDVMNMVVTEDKVSYVSLEDEDFE